MTVAKNISGKGSESGTSQSHACLNFAINGVVWCQNASQVFVLTDIAQKNSLSSDRHKVPIGLHKLELVSQGCRVGSTESCDHTSLPFLHVEKESSFVEHALQRLYNVPQSTRKSLGILLSPRDSNIITPNHGNPTRLSRSWYWLQEATHLENSPMTSDIKRWKIKSARGDPGRVPLQVTVNRWGPPTVHQVWLWMSLMTLIRKSGTPWDAHTCQNGWHF